MKRYKLGAIVAVAALAGAGATVKAADAAPSAQARDQGRHRLLATGLLVALRRAVHRGPQGRPPVRDERHEQVNGQRSSSPSSTTPATREGRLRGEGPDRQGLQDPRRQRLVGRRPSGRAARRAEQGPVHLRPGRERRDHRASTSTRSAPAGRATRTCSRRVVSSARALGRTSRVRPGLRVRPGQQAAVKAVIGRGGHNGDPVLVPLTATGLHAVRAADQAAEAGPRCSSRGPARRRRRCGRRSTSRACSDVDHGRHRPRPAGDLADLRPGRHKI